MKTIFGCYFFLVCNVSLAQLALDRFTDDEFIGITLTSDNYDLIESELLEFSKTDRGKRVTSVDIIGVFDRIPDFLIYLENLNMIHAGSTERIVLDDSLVNLKKLRHLTILTVVSHISESLVLNELLSLEISFLARKGFPKTICRWSELRHLFLAGGTFKNIPDDIGNLKKLEHLNLPDNRIESLPEEIGLLTKLKSLGLSSNLIKLLPNTICELSSLVDLWVVDNVGLTISSKQKECLAQQPYFDRIYD